MSDGIETFEEWKAKHEQELLHLEDLCCMLLPDNQVELAGHLSLVQAQYQRILYLLADADFFVLTSRIKQIFAVKEDFPDMTGPERKAIVEGKIAHILHQRDRVNSIAQGLKGKQFAAMNLRKNHNAEAYTEQA